jgi:predicted nucleic acid-binding protein
VRIFLDPNILFSAARADGAVRQLLALIEAARHEQWAETYVVEEARRNLTAKSPGGLAALDAMTARITIVGFNAGAALSPDLFSLPEKDRPVLGSAIHHQCNILISGDRTHFGPLFGKIIQGVSILSPAMLANTLCL